MRRLHRARRAQRSGRAKTRQTRPAQRSKTAAPAGRCVSFITHSAAKTGHGGATGHGGRIHVAYFTANPSTTHLIIPQCPPVALLHMQTADRAAATRGVGRVFPYLFSRSAQADGRDSGTSARPCSAASSVGAPSFRAARQHVSATLACAPPVRCAMSTACAVRHEHRLCGAP